MFDGKGELFLTAFDEHNIRKPITQEVKEWEPGLDVVLPIDGGDLPGFKAWVNWNGFHLNKETGKGHKGYDFTAYLTTDNRVIFGLPQNTKIRAVADGRVAQVLDAPEAVGGGYGVTINLEHGIYDSGMFSSYIHVQPLVEEGDKVKKGDVIAELYKDPGIQEGRLVHLHMQLTSGWGTRGTSIMGGGRDIRTDDPSVLSEDIYKYNAKPQGKSDFIVEEIPGAQIITANFREIRVNS